MSYIRGRIIRILDKRTVIVNLGREDGIDKTSVFRILAEPESIIDPVTGEELGKVNVIKSKVGASEVYEKFTIATTRWVMTVYRTRFETSVAQMMGNLMETETEIVDEGELLVKPSDIQPWKAQSEIPVQVGDVVEVRVQDETKKPDTNDESQVEERTPTDRSSAEIKETSETSKAANDGE